MRRVSRTQSASRPANPWSAKTFRIGVVRYADSSAVLAPSRSCQLAAITATVTSRPVVSVVMNRLRPLTFLFAS